MKNKYALLLVAILIALFNPSCTVVPTHNGGVAILPAQGWNIAPNMQGNRYYGRPGAYNSMMAQRGPGYGMPYRNVRMMPTYGAARVIPAPGNGYNSYGGSYGSAYNHRPSYPACNNRRPVYYDNQGRFQGQLGRPCVGDSSWQARFSPPNGLHGSGGRLW